MIADSRQLFPAVLLAQSNSAVSAVLMWSIGLLLVVVIMFILIAWLRKRLSPTQESGPVGFSLSDIRALRKQGAISPEEYERAKAKIIQGLQTSGLPGTQSTNTDVPPSKTREKS